VRRGRERTHSERIAVDIQQERAPSRPGEAAGPLGRPPARPPVLKVVAGDSRQRSGLHLRAGSGRLPAADHDNVVMPVAGFRSRRTRGQGVRAAVARTGRITGRVQ